MSGRPELPDTDRNVRRRERSRVYYAANAERERAKARAYHAAHRETRNAKARDRVAVKRDRLEYRRAWYAEHRDEQRAKTQAYQATHKEQARAYRIAHLEENRDQRRAYDNLHVGRKLAQKRIRKYGIPAEWVAEMLDAQESCCAICEDPIGPNAHLDHNHTTGEPRALLCRRCNLRLDALEDPVWVESAASYLEVHGAAVAS